METSLEYAETHFAQILRRVVEGEEVILRNGSISVARIVPVPSATKVQRPQVGMVTSAPVRWNEESFAALDEQGLKDLGLL